MGVLLVGLRQEGHELPTGEWVCWKERLTQVDQCLRPHQARDPSDNIRSSAIPPSTPTPSQLFRPPVQDLK